MRKRLLHALIFLSFSNLIYSQKWHAYSDSILVNLNKNNIEKARHFLDLSDNELNMQFIKKDTIYADFLYRKGVLKYRIGDFTPKIFEESISIWNSSETKNYLKITKNFYFLGEGYNMNKEYNKAYINYEKCYFLNKENNLKNNVYFSNSIYCLSVIDYRENFNFKNAERYAEEYIELNKEVAYLNFDFNYAYAYRWKEDTNGYENVLLLFKQNYDKANLNNPRIYLQINYLLFEHYYRQNYYYRKHTFKNIVFYGEEFIQYCEEFNMKNEYDKALKSIYRALAISYSNINDDKNSVKYKNLIKK